MDTARDLIERIDKITIELYPFESGIVLEDEELMVKLEEEVNNFIIAKGGSI